MIHIIIPVFNRLSYTKECIESLQNQSFRSFQIIIVDHGSSDGTSSFINTFYPDIIIVKGDESMWWTAATNLGINYALNNGADFILTLNNDLIVDKDYLKNLHEMAQINPKSIIGSVSVDISDKEKVVYAGTIWNRWTAKYSKSVELSDPYKIFKSKFSQITTDLLPGRGTLIPISAFKEIGMFDQNRFPHYMADEDFSLKSKKKGYKLLINPFAVVYSHTTATGLANVHVSKNFNYWKDLFTSIRSPNNIGVRWNWAKQNSPIPQLYFILDYSRIIGSQLKQLIS